MLETTFDPTLARVIEAARQSKRLTKYRLAVRSGLSLQTVRLACQGIATTRTRTLLARALGVDVDVLTGRKETP